VIDPTQSGSNLTFDRCVIFVANYFFNDRWYPYRQRDIRGPNLVHAPEVLTVVVLVLPVLLLCIFFLFVALLVWFALFLWFFRYCRHSSGLCLLDLTTVCFFPRFRLSFRCLALAPLGVICFLSLWFFQCCHHFGELRLSDLMTTYSPPVYDLPLDVQLLLYRIRVTYRKREKE
jgi:hypothetical protein